MFLSASKTTKWVIKQLKTSLIHQNLFLNAIKLNKCVIKNFIDVFFVFDSIPGRCKTQQICDIVASYHPFLIVYCPDKYETYINV